MINNTNHQRWDRLNAKNLDNQFLSELYKGLNCSRFEAMAILEKVHEVFDPLFDSSGKPKPGQIQISVVSSEAPPNVSLQDAEQKLVTLTLFSSEDLDLRKHNDVKALRQSRMERMTVEAFQQGGVMTVEDFAYKIFNCGIRTLLRDLKEMREREVFIPLRSMIKDMGRAITHRKRIITLWLHGNEYSDIAKKSCHSVQSVHNYVEKFKRCVGLFNNGFDIHTTAFLVQISPSLTQEFFNIFKNAEQTSEIVSHRIQELNRFTQKNNLHPSESRNRS